MQPSSTWPFRTPSRGECGSTESLQEAVARCISTSTGSNRQWLRSGHHDPGAPALFTRSISGNTPGSHQQDETALKNMKRRKPSIAARPCIAFVRLYQVTLSPFIGKHCRFQPTCSNYSIEAFRIHGAWRGFWLTIKRLSRCHPMGTAGYDPVPGHECCSDEADPQEPDTT